MPGSSGPLELVEHAASGCLVIFVGAGVSMPPPTCLPSWTQVNEILLDAISEHAAVFTDVGFARELRDDLVATRNATSWFTPDYQAQMIEDEIGHEYFRLLQVLDTDDWNEGHAAIATLAASGRLAAIVTTNFDRLLERALDDAAVPHRVFSEPDHFDALAETLAARAGPLPVIKVHGSVESPSSMVDTLRQRVRGRPESLNAAIAGLVADNHVLFVGFSGADLSYDPDYLGLRRAAHRNRGFTCVFRPGSEPQDMRELAIDWGGGAQLVEGNLPEWLADLGMSLDLSWAPKVVDAVAVNRAPAIRAGAGVWAGSLGHMVTASLLAALLDSSGREGLAFDLLVRTLRSTASERDMEATGYASFNLQLGRRLLERGMFDVSLESSRRREVERNRGYISPYTANDCFQCLNRSLTRLDGHIEMGLYETYWGRPQEGAERIRAARDQALEQGAVGVFVDACVALGVVYEILMQFADALDWLERAHELARVYGDEPRRARVCAELGRFLAIKARHDEAIERIDEGLVVADRLSLHATRLHLLSARGSALLEQQKTRPALVALIEAANGQRATARRPALTRTLIDVGYIQFESGNWPAMEAATDELVDLTDLYVGYRPLLCLMRARGAATFGASDDARYWIELAQSAASAFQNPGILEEIGLLEAKLASP